MIVDPVIDPLVSTDVPRIVISSPSLPVTPPVGQAAPALAHEIVLFVIVNDVILVLKLST